jgi:hypothetical protein
LLLAALVSGETIAHPLRLPGFLDCIATVTRPRLFGVAVRLSKARIVTLKGR